MKKTIFLALVLTIFAYSCYAVDISHVNSESKALNLMPVQGSKEALTKWTVKYSDYGFYIDVTCFDKNMKGITVNKVERDSDLSKDDSIEIRIKPNWDDDKMTDYYRYEVNVNNVQADAKNLNYKENVFFKTSVEKQSNCWIAHFYIPYVSMGINNNTYLKHDEWVDTSAMSCPIYPILNFYFNIERRYHPGKADEGLYIWQVSKDGKLPWGVITMPPIHNFSKLIVTEPVKLVAHKNIGMKGNKFTLYYFVIGNYDYTKSKTPRDWEYFKVYDYVTGKTYAAKGGVCNIDFDKKGVHKLMGVIYNSDNEIIGYSNMVNIKL